MALFDNLNMFSKMNADDKLPTQNDIYFLKGIHNLTRYSQITDDMFERLELISDDIDYIIDYNNSIDTNDDKDFRLVKLDDAFLDLLNKTKDKIGILQTGGVTKYRKDKLKDTIRKELIAPVGYDWQKEYMCYYPEDYNRKLKPKGNWILILDKYAVVSAPTKHSIHYATPIAKTKEVYGGKYKMWYASIIVNNKEVLLYPYEYIVIQDANLLLEMIDKGVTMIEGSKSARLDKNKVFYLKSRGFNQADIYKILFKSVNTKGFCHFQADVEFSDMISAMQKGVNPNFLIKISEHRKKLKTIKFEKVC